jgi:hypothetical protein
MQRGKPPSRAVPDASTSQSYTIFVIRGAAWLVAAHRQLDVAVAAGYSWSPDLSDEEILAALGALHQARQGEALGNSDEPEA